jgi:hypothetical protein
MTCLPAHGQVTHHKRLLAAEAAGLDGGLDGSHNVLVCLFPLFVHFPYEPPDTATPRLRSTPTPQTPICHMANGDLGSGTWHMATWHMGTWGHGEIKNPATRITTRNWRNQLVYVFNCCFRAKIPSKRVDQFSAGHIPSASSTQALELIN